MDNCKLDLGDDFQEIENERKRKEKGISRFVAAKNAIFLCLGLLLCVEYAMGNLISYNYSKERWQEMWL